MEQTNSLALLIPEIKQLLQEKNYTLLKQAVKECTPVEFVNCWKSFSEDERLQIFKLQSTKVALKVFEILDVEDQRALLAKLSEEGVAPILENIDSPDLAKIFHKMPPRMMKRMSMLIKHQESLSKIDYLMKFPENSAGSLMHPEFVKMTPKMTAKQALLLLQSIMRPGQKKHLTELFVVNEEGKVLGNLNIQDLLSAPPDEKLEILMSSVEGIKVKPETDQEEVYKLFEKYHLTSAPVVDPAGRLIGVLTTDDIISVVQQEATEDIQKMGGVEALNKPYLSVGFYDMLKKRAVWLAVLFVGELLTASAMSYFEHEIAKAVVLALFVPLIISSGGNAGSQATTLIIRAMALGEVKLSDWWKIVYREAGIGLGLGVILALIGVVRIFAWESIFHVYGEHYMLIAAAVGLTLVGIVLWGTLAGSMLPFILKKLGLDPASSSAPFVATLVDVSGIVIYFTACAFILKGTLL